MASRGSQKDLCKKGLDSGRVRKKELGVCELSENEKLATKTTPRKALVTVKAYG